jgi:hypothetical protein
MDMCVKLELSNLAIDAYDMMRSFEVGFVPKKIQNPLGDTPEISTDFDDSLSQDSNTNKNMSI